MDMRFTPEEIAQLASKLQEFKEQIVILKKFERITGVALYYNGYSTTTLGADYTEKNRRFLFDLQRNMLKGLLDDMSEAGIDVDELRDQLGAVNASYNSKEPE